MYVFLASSLNVELVYSILKGVTQFGYLTLCEPDEVSAKLKKMQKVTVNGDTTLTFFEIKIKNSQVWNKNSYQDFMQDTWAKNRQTTMRQTAMTSSVSEGKQEMLVLKMKVSVTFHMMERFKRLFELWGINDFANFYASLSPKFNREMIFKAGEGAGRSGSFFFFSHDRKFVIKTMTTGELTLVKKMLNDYAGYLEKHPDSLLSKILGIFTVEASSFSKVHIMLMENTVRLKDPKRIKYVFDLKGSTVDRLVKGKIGNNTTLKDVNFLMIKKKWKHLTTLRESTTKRLREAMRNDVAFLRSQGLMDYSILIAIEKTGDNKANLHNEK